MRRGGEGNSRVGDEKGDGGQGIGRRNKGVMREVQYMGEWEGREREVAGEERIKG